MCSRYIYERGTILVKISILKGNIRVSDHLGRASPYKTLLSTPPPLLGMKMTDY